MKFGICKLCNKESELKKSHTIPRSVFKKSLLGFKYLKMLDRDNNKIINTQDQWTSYMLCGDCEQLISRYEKYSLEALRGDLRSSKIQYKIDYLQIVNVDQRRLINFVISIFWRSLESHHKIFHYHESMGISEDIRQYLRKCIYHNTLLREQIHTVRISKLVTNIPAFKHIDLNIITTLTYSVIQTGFIKILFIMEGYCFEIFLHAKPNIRVPGLGVLKGNKHILKMPYIDAFSIPELNKVLSEMLSANTK